MYELLCLLLCDRADPLFRSKGFPVLLAFSSHIHSFCYVPGMGQMLFYLWFPFILHDNPDKMGLGFPFQRWGNWDAEIGNDWSRGHIHKSGQSRHRNESPISRSVCFVISIRFPQDECLHFLSWHLNLYSFIYPFNMSIYHWAPTMCKVLGPKAKHRSLPTFSLK